MKYEVPVCELIKLSYADIITISNVGDNTDKPGETTIVDMPGGRDPGQEGSES